MTFLLKEIEGNNIGEEFALLPGENLVGRSRSSNIRVYNEDVSGKHFVLSVSDKGVLLRNLSHYGTMLDGELVRDSAEIREGQKIRAGRSLCFELLRNDGAEADPEATAAEETSVTKFVSDVTKTDPNGVPGPADENQTGVTKFVREGGDADQPENEATSVTKFASDSSQTDPGIPDGKENGGSPDMEDRTGVTRFAPGTLPAGSEERENGKGKTAEAGKNGSGVLVGFRNTPENISPGWKEKTSVEKAVVRVPDMDDGNRTQVEEVSPFSTVLSDKTSPGSEDMPEESGERTLLEDKGMFFEEETTEGGRTNANETQVVQTRMASADEMSFIKSQIKKQQQSRLFLRFLIFAFLAVCLGVVWMMKSPQKEQVLSWPHGKKGAQIEYYTANVPAWGGFENGGFDLYCPLWSRNTVNSGMDTITINTFLGKNGDVPLTITLHREDSLEHVYENRNNALQGALKRLSELPDEMFNFESNTLRTFLVPASGPPENAIPCDVISYQRDKGQSWFGVLRFFRSGKYNYILRAEVPAAEKLRAVPILTTDNFLNIHRDFVRRNWEGNDEYVKGDVDRMLLGVRDELLNHNSPMQYPRLEWTIKSVLAQTRYHNQRKKYQEAMELLLLLRDKQQQWYNGQRIRWASAVREHNPAEKARIRHESEAVFSINGDKRRYDILRDHWE